MKTIIDSKITITDMNDRWNFSIETMKGSTICTQIRLIHQRYGCYPVTTEIPPATVKVSQLLS
jgi:hypothetical protein